MGNRRVCRALASLLVLASLGATAVGYVQWRVRQARMRLGRPLGHMPVQILLAVVFVLLAGVVTVAIALTPGGR